MNITAVEVDCLYYSLIQANSVWLYMHDIGAHMTQILQSLVLLIPKFALNHRLNGFMWLSHAVRGGCIHLTVLCSLVWLEIHPGSSLEPVGSRHFLN